MEEADAERSEDLAIEIVYAEDLTEVDLPSPSSGTVRPYGYWTTGLLYLISDSIIGRTHRDGDGTDWTGVSVEIDRAQGGLAAALYEWREKRKGQLSKERYAQLEANKAQAWCKWLRTTQHHISNVAACFRASHGDKVAIIQAGAAIVSCVSF